MTVFHFRIDGGPETPLYLANTYHAARVAAFNILVLAPEDVTHGLLLRSNGRRKAEVGVLFRDWRFLALDGDAYGDFLEHPESFGDRIVEEHPRFLRRVFTTIDGGRELAFDATVYFRETSDELYRRRFGVDPPEPRETWCRFSRGSYRESPSRVNGATRARCYVFPEREVGA